MTATVILPLAEGDTLGEKAVTLPAGTPYIVAGHGEGEWAETINQAVAASATEFVFIGASDGWLDPQALDFLTGLAWDADVTYGNLIQVDGDEQTDVRQATFFCPNLLRVEPYLPELALVRRTKFLEVGGVKSGMWDLWWRLHEAGARFKAVPEANAARLNRYQDDSPAPPGQDYQATIYHQATPGTTYWRCALPARYLPAVMRFSYPRRYEDHQGTAVMQFTGDIGHQMLAMKLREDGVRVVVEVDDNYLAWTPYMRRAGWKETIREATPAGAYSAEGHRKTCGFADAIITTTEHMAKQYRKVNPNVLVCPNQIDPDDWPAVPKPDDGVFRIGWFASRSHSADSELIVAACDWASRQKDVEIVMFGCGVHPNGKPWFKFPFKFVPWSNDLSVYKKMIGELDVGLAPVIGHPWARCRSDLKILEYAMHSTVTVASDYEPYADWTDGDKCLKAKDAKGFLRAVQRLVGNRDEAKELGRQAHDYVLKERTMAANIWRWEEAICKV